MFQPKANLVNVDVKSLHTINRALFRKTNTATVFPEVDIYGGLSRPKSLAVDCLFGLLSLGVLFIQLQICDRIMPPDYMCGLWHRILLFIVAMAVYGYWINRIAVAQLTMVNALEARNQMSQVLWLNYCYEVSKDEALQGELDERDWRMRNPLDRHLEQL